MSDGGAADALFGAGGGDGGQGGGSGAGEAGGGQGGGNDQGGASGGGQDGGQGDSGGNGGQGGGGVETWYGALGLSDAAEGDKPSDLQWLQNKGYKDFGTTVKAMRSLESRVGGAIVPPKEGDAPEKFEAFYKALGRPDTADGYEINLPEGGKIDEGLFTSFREMMFKGGAPKALAESAAQWYVQQQLDQNAGTVASRNQEVDDTYKEWGTMKDANLALCNRAAARLGLSRTDIANIQQGYGAGSTLKLLAKLGGGMAEDAALGHGGGRQDFGMSPTEARAELDKFEKDPANVKALRNKDPAVTARWERLTAAIAAGMDEDDRRNGG